MTRPRAAFSENQRTILCGVALGLACVATATALPANRFDHLLCCGTPAPGAQHGRSIPSGDRPFDLADAAPPPESTRLPGPGPADPARGKLPTPFSKPGAVANSGGPPPAASRALAGPSLAALAGPLETISGYAKISFSQLAGFKFQPPPQPVPADQSPPDVLAQVPAAIRRLDGKKVVLTGYMLPLKLEKGFAIEFFFLSSPSLCCYGITPEVNDWMLVKMRKEGLPAVQDVPVFLAGRLRVRAQWNDGYLTGIYEMDGDGLLPAKR